MSDWIWIAANLGLGLPLAAGLLILAREVVRGLIGLAFGFRVFEIQLGAGRKRAEFQLGSVDVALADLPIAGTTIARSGAPKRHRLARLALATAPLLAQVGWLLARLVMGTPPGSAPLFDGPALLACLDLANCLLLVLHSTAPVELPGGVRTDIRLLLDAALGRADSNRAARSNYYTRLARHRLERADVEGARAAVSHGLTQLGPEALLVTSQTELDATELSSVIDQGECADRLSVAIESSEPRRQIERARWTLMERLRQGFFSAAPLTIALVCLGLVQADRLARSIETGMLGLSDRAALAGDADACAAMENRWQIWSREVDPWLPPGEADRSRRHLGLAGLARCRSDLRTAEQHHSEALLAANAAGFSDPSKLFRDPEKWLDNELRMALLLREAAELGSKRSSYREALVTLTRAERRLSSLGGKLGLLGEGEDRHLAGKRLDQERIELEATRSRVLASMAAR